MPCSPNAPASWRAFRYAGRIVRGWLLMLGMLAALLAMPALVQAQSSAPAFSDVRFELTDDVVRMTGNIRFTLSDTVQETLNKGVPVYFVFETDTVRIRWYWADQSVYRRSRYMRLAYLPLTRKWRVNASSEPLNRSANGVLLNQNFDSLQAALAVIQRISNWQVLEKGDWSSDAQYAVETRFRLDVSQLQRPLQIGTTGQSDWNLDAQRKFRLVQQDLVK